MAILSVRWVCISFFVMLLAILGTVIFREETVILLQHPSAFPKPIRKYWGSKEPASNDMSVRSFIPYNKQYFQTNDAAKTNEKLTDIYTTLWLKQQKGNPSKHAPIISEVDTDFNKLSLIKGEGYGINYNDFHSLVEYFKDKFDWEKQKKIIETQMKHYMSNIQGLDIHFVKHSLNSNRKNIAKGNIDCILMLHGWPSSFWEYHRLLSVFQSQYRDSQVDVIIASLPGYGFSDYPMYHTGFDTAAIAEIFRELIEDRLSYSSYIVVGGDWGSAIAHNIAYSVSCASEKQKLKGIYLTMSGATPPLHDMLLLMFNSETINQWLANKYGVSLERVQNAFNPFMEKFFLKTWNMFGYQHEQATRSDTIGIALESSPISNLAYIYEKFLSWSDSSDIAQFDENGRRTISGQLTWDDVIVTNYLFYLNGKVPSGIRYYTESLYKSMLYMPRIYIPKDIAVGVSTFEGDPFSGATGLVHKWHYKNIIFQNYHPKGQGGHFPALEHPQILYKDILQFLRLL